jgi:hypothetical protein
MSGTFSQTWDTLVEGQVYLVTVVGHLTKEQAADNDVRFCGILDVSTASMVHLIVDGRKMLSIPSITDNSQTRFPYHPRMGYNVNIDMFRNPTTRFVISILTKIMRLRHKDVQTLEEACAFLISKDPNLPPLATWALPAAGNTSNVS